MADEPQESEDLRIDLSKSIIPELAAKGYIEWDPHTGTIRKGPRFDELEPYLKAMDNHDDLPADRET